ncbi:MAG: hypothetical protein KDC87_18205, partial [Planctomycetes bacterium]|nr:hypothetical protein [Planctomycetota bacterium]
MNPGVKGPNPTLEAINGQPSGPDYVAAAAGGRLHVTHEAKFTGASLPSLDECFYSSAEFNTSGTLVRRKPDVAELQLARGSLCRHHVDA